ncbi:MAG: sigma-70 factor domain-containing protein [Minisyncoccota bacterium]
MDLSITEIKQKEVKIVAYDGESGEEEVVERIEEEEESSSVAEGEDILKMFLNQIGKIPVLNTEKERELFKKISGLNMAIRSLAQMSSHYHAIESSPGIIEHPEHAEEGDKPLGRKDAALDIFVETLKNDVPHLLKYFAFIREHPTTGDEKSMLLSSLARLCCAGRRRSTAWDSKTSSECIFESQPRKKWRSD